MATPSFHRPLKGEAGYVEIVGVAARFCHATTSAYLSKHQSDILMDIQRLNEILSRALIFKLL